MAALVVGDALAILAGEKQRPLGAEHDLLQRVVEVLLAHRAFLAPRGEQRRLVHQVLEVRAGEARRGRCQLRKPHVGVERHLARVHLEDRLAPRLVGQVNDHAPVEAPGAQQRAVEHVGLVGGGEHLSLIHI